MKRSFLRPRRSKNCCSVPMRSPSVRPTSATTPSIWWNSARWVRSMASLRKTRSTEKYLAGAKPRCARA